MHVHNTNNLALPKELEKNYQHLTLIIGANIVLWSVQHQWLHLLLLFMYLLMISQFSFCYFTLDLIIHSVPTYKARTH